MASEVSVNSSMSIQKMDADGVTPVISRSYQGNTRGDMSAARGPSPGMLKVEARAAGGTQVSFAQLTQPGWCWMEHQGRYDGSASQTGDYVDVGIYDPTTHKFYPLMELRPGMKLPVPLSRNLQETFLGPGTGSAGLGETAKLMLVAYPAGVAQKVSVEGYDT